MAVKMLSEVAPHDSEVRRIMDDHKDRMRASIENGLVKAQAIGELPADKSPEMIASLIMIFMDGLATQAVGPMKTEEAHALLDGQLESLL